ncbi:putative ABC transport system permease protein [Desulfitispora alkaliphila]|uniref:ABC transporter permease n=1 Tax=Desulfitispora alkaliphila TaxID=622674 RepID=UPI003D1E3227
MRLDSIVFKNLKRRKGKALFTILSITLAIGTIMSLYSSARAINVELADRFDEIGANVLVVPATEHMSVTYGGVSVAGTGGSSPYLENDHVMDINTIPNSENIATVAPKLLVSLPALGEERATIMGVDFPQELRLKPWWEFQGTLPRGVGDVMLGANVANQFDLSPGDQLTISGEEFEVTAVLETQGNEEDGLIFMQLLRAQNLSGLENKLSLVEVAAYCTTCPIEEIVADINEIIPEARASAVGEAVKAREEVVDRFTNFATLIAIVVVITGAMVVGLTAMSSVNQRVGEIGVFRALGYRKKHIAEIVLTEALMLGAIGGILGFLLGTVAANWLAPNIAGIELAVGVDFITGGLSVIGAIVLSLLAAIYPAIRASQLDPVEALRAI